jgi:hypothetical protein
LILDWRCVGIPDTCQTEATNGGNDPTGDGNRSAQCCSHDRKSLRTHLPSWLLCPDATALAKLDPVVLVVSML